MTVFPLEIYGLVAEQVSHQQTLLDLCCISSAIRLEVERVLYRTIHIQKYVGSESIVDILLDRLTATPRQALLVKSLRLEFKKAILPQTETKLAATLPALANLVQLDIHINGVHVQALTRGCIFRLRRFTYVDHISEASISLGDFLARQPLIRHLSVHMYETDASLPSDILPNLVTLECPAYLGQALGLTRRPIEKLSWRSSDNYLASSLSGPRPTLLVLALCEIPRRFDIPSYFPNLRLLECPLSARPTNDIRHLNERLKGLSFLHTFRDSTKRTPRMTLDAQEVDEVSRGLMEVLGSLQLVQIGMLQRRRGGDLETRQANSQFWFEWMDSAIR